MPHQREGSPIWLFCRELALCGLRCMTLCGLLPLTPHLHAQGSNFWNLYTAETADDDPYRITLDDTSTMGIIDSHVSLLAHACACSHVSMHPVRGGMLCCTVAFKLSVTLVSVRMISPIWPGPCKHASPFYKGLTRHALIHLMQAAQVNTIAGQQDPGCTTGDGTNSNAAPFPGKAQACTCPCVHT